MSKYLVAAALLTLSACGPKTDSAPAADSAAAAAATPAPAPAAAADTTVKVAGDTAKKP
jgi:hypothetical protein